MTFSVINGTNIESISYQMSGYLGSQSNFDELLNRLPDNIDGLINPSDIRDILLSVCSSTVFKLTTATSSNIPYIGIDNLNPDDNDLAGRKILLGKKQYQSTDIIDDLINSDYDVLIYNTKSDEYQQLTTRVGFLSGIDNHQDSPFIQSQILFGTTSVSFDFNSSGDINISSQNNIINDLSLPIGASPSNNQIIRWGASNSMIYDNIIRELPTDIGTSSQALDILGSDVSINGFNIDFFDNRKCTVNIGDIKIGDNLSNSNISEILERIVYKYLPPSITTAQGHITQERQHLQSTKKVQPNLHPIDDLCHKTKI